MKKLKITKIKSEKKLIPNKFRHCIEFWILACCLVVLFNIHPSDIYDTNLDEKPRMIYVFHDYEWNEYVINGTTHGSADSRQYLFDDEVPSTVKWENVDNDPISLGAKQWDSTTQWSQTWNLADENSNTVKDNQISIENIINDLWVDVENSKIWNNYTVIEVNDSNEPNNTDSYVVKGDLDGPTLVIEKEGNDDNLLVAQTFTFTAEWWVIPVLVPWDYLDLDGSLTEDSSNGWYQNNSSSNAGNDVENTKQPGITIIDDYKDCMTPWWYKIVHWDSVLAYKQLDNAPDICNIERRYCRDWKLSWTYTQQWCYVNENYSYDILEGNKVTSSKAKTEENKAKYNNIYTQETSWSWRWTWKWKTIQNPDWTVTVKSDKIVWSFVFERPNNRYTEYYDGDNYKEEAPWIEQTTRPHPGCTTPRWEKLQHGEITLAFKHANWFSDAPCESQLRLCTMWELLWTYTESTCQTRDTSFIDWINGSPTRKTYSEEKLERVKRQIENEEIYYENARKQYDRSTNSDALDRILYILDQD